MNLEINDELDKNKGNSQFEELIKNISDCLETVKEKLEDTKDNIAEKTLDIIQTINNRANDTYYYIASDYGNSLTVQIFENGRRVDVCHMHRSEFPQNTKEGSALRLENGNLFIDEELTEKIFLEEQRISKALDDLRESFKTEGTSYKIKEIEGDFIRLINQDTGVCFKEYDYTKDFLHKLESGMMLKYQNGEYIIDNNYNGLQIEEKIDDNTLIWRTIEKNKNPIENQSATEKIIDNISDFLIEKLEAKGYGDRNTYFVDNTHEKATRISQRFSGSGTSFGEKYDMETGTILRKVNGKYEIDEELTKESLKRIEEMKK